MPKRLEIQGQRFGKLVVLRFHSLSRNGQARWQCRCDCGTEKDILSTHLVGNKIKSCGCSRPRGKDHKQWTGYGEISGQFWNSVQRGADGTKGRRKIEITITIEDAWRLFLDQNRKCALTGLILKLGSRYTEPGTASLDRIDSGIGYVPGNVQWIHKDVNRMKNSFDQSYFIDMCRLVSGSCEIDYSGLDKKLEVVV